MSWIDAALWGLFGSFAVEGLDLYTAVRRHGRWPWRVRGPREVGALGYAVAELIRLIIGGGLAWAAAASGQLTSAVGALAVGVAAPLIVERITRAVPLSDSVQEPRDGTDQSTVSPTTHTQEHAADQTSADSRAATVALGEREGQRPAVEHQCVYTDEAEQAAPQGAERHDRARE